MKEKLYSVNGGEVTARVLGELVMIEKSHPILRRETMVVPLNAFLQLAKKIEAEQKKEAA